MPHRYLVDAHAIVWYFEGNPRLGPAAKIALSDRSNNFIVPVIALAEALRTVSSGRTSIPSCEKLIDALDADPRFTFESLDRELVLLAESLTAVSEMHDRMIAASAIRRTRAGEMLSLITRGAAITRSGLVPVTW
jgi:PIN domain nuclease of toxin-antitoxin system